MEVPPFGFVIDCIQSYFCCEIIRNDRNNTAAGTVAQMINSECGVENMYNMYMYMTACMKIEVKGIIWLLH